MRGRDQILTRKEKDDRESCSKDREKDGRSRLPVRLTHWSFLLRYQVKPFSKKYERVKYVESTNGKIKLHNSIFFNKKSNDASLYE